MPLSYRRRVTSVGNGELVIRDLSGREVASRNIQLQGQLLQIDASELEFGSLSCRTDYHGRSIPRSGTHSLMIVSSFV